MFWCKTRLLPDSLGSLQYVFAFFVVRGNTSQSCCCACNKNNRTCQYNTKEGASSDAMFLYIKISCMWSWCESHMETVAQFGGTRVLHGWYTCWDTVANCSFPAQSQHTQATHVHGVAQHSSDRLSLYSKSAPKFLCTMTIKFISALWHEVGPKSDKD